jgi:hypothetical protein
MFLKIINSVFGLNFAMLNKSRMELQILEEGGERNWGVMALLLVPRRLGLLF